MILDDKDQTITLRWRHNGRDGISNHQPHDCLRNCLFRRRSKEISKLRVTGLCAGNSQDTGEFPTQRASKVKNVSIWWRHHNLRKMVAKNSQTWSISHNVFQLVLICKMTEQWDINCVLTNTKSACRQIGTVAYKWKTYTSNVCLPNLNAVYL